MSFPSTNEARTGRVLFYIQHLYGIGHLKRAAAIAAAMARIGLDVTVAHGGMPVAGMEWPGVDLVQLPAAAIRGGDFSQLVDEAGRDVDEAWRVRRASALADLADRVRPDAVLFELFPFGRRQFRFELLALIERLRERSPRPAILSSVRDILVASPKPGREREAADLVLAAFDEVLVHGDPAFVPFETSFGEAARIAGKLRYTGYVSSDLRALDPASGAQADDDDPTAPGAGEIVVSAGGGAAGGPLWRHLLEARRLGRAHALPWRLIAGPRLPAQAYADLEAAAAKAASVAGSGPIAVERFRSDFPAVLRRAALSISQGGYNTTIDLLATGVPAIVVPIGEAEETEQTERAARLAERFYIRLFPEERLSDPAAFAAEIDAALADAPRRRAMPAAEFALKGAETSAAILAEHVRRVRGG
ncbi:glycosyltransferase [Aureimonas sp. Leaf454]|uniref:glycosyltransferase family protein n=1 Tax=Aureimonas sp. Leaf454 TaxID=1736381 RepID=UPI001FCCE67A|nr:glycosyltransferase [Aureimonas sp. Leaf454]